MTKFSIESYKPQDGLKRETFTLVIDFDGKPFKVKFVRLVELEGKPPFLSVSVPMFQNQAIRRDENGKTIFKEFLNIPSELQEQIISDIKPLIDAERSKAN